jgi:arsenite-transporting ATPase
MMREISNSGGLWMRVILYTGKGGVGKTSVAAATALLCARRGHRTAIMSTDPAHSLADSFEMPLKGEMTPIADNLWGQEVDVFRELQTHWRTIQKWLASVFRWQGMNEVVAEEMAVLPGTEELAALLHIVHYRRGGDFEVLVVDCAPTGETLRLLSFPDMMRWYMHRFFPIGKRVATAVGPLARGMLGLPTPDRGVFDSIYDLYLQVEEMRRTLLDADISSMRLVVNPEKMVIKETQRTFTYLSLYGYNTDLVVCNRMLPAEASGEFFDYWRQTQADYVGLVHESFDPIPILTAPLLPREAVGREALQELGEDIFGDEDPARVFSRGHAQEVSTEDGRRVLRISLPFAIREDISVMENDGELVVQAGRYRRNILLPRALVNLGVEEAIKEGDVLKIVLGPRARQGSTTEREAQGG